MQLKNIDNSEYLNSNNFLKISDTFYAAYIQNSDLKNYKKENYRVLLNENGSSLIKNKSFELRENDVIFCHSMLLIPLFNHLKNITKFKNIKLISHQSDISIDKKLFNKKPDCISKWYSTNVNYSHKDLIPIPIGIGNDSNKKTLTSADFINLSFTNNKIEKIYCNYNLYTNYRHRYKALKNLYKKQFIEIDFPNLNKEDFVKNLSNYKFILAPWGNGFDTHRLWEALYAGSIPITKSHKSLTCFNEFPIVYVDKYEDLNFENLKTIKYEYQKKLKISYWKDLIKNNEEPIKGSVIHFTENKNLHDVNIRLFFKLYHRQNRYKFLNTIYRKFHKKFLGKKIHKLIGL